MSKKNKRSPTKQRSVTVGTFENFFSTTSCDSASYVRLSDCPEVQTCVHVIADLVSNMTIHLMKNTDKGDIRIKNGLSRAVDIEPNDLMTRKSFIYWIVKRMLTDGNADVFPRFNAGTKELESLNPITGSYSYRTTDEGFEIYKPPVTYKDDEILHFVFNPSMEKPWLGEGFKVHLADIMINLKQAAMTKKAFMTDQFKPTVVIAVDGLTDEMGYDEGRDKIRKQFGIETANGQPWIIPQGMVSVEQIKPLTLQDIAIDASVQLDKKSVGAMFQVPPYYLGLGIYNKDEHNSFISGPIMSIATIIQQTLTKGLLYSPDYYWMLNAMSLYNYSITDLFTVFGGLSDKGIFTPNEVRDKFNASPMEGMDVPRILENYIPVSKIGDQKKLLQEGGE